MPLSFKSDSHGTIAFGFFNIETDMLLLENYFFFAKNFCKGMIEMAAQTNGGRKKIQLPVYYIADPEDIGDLMEAIHGIRFNGFIGKVYTLFPFPEDEKAFKQNPEGYQTRKIIIGQVEPVAEKKELAIEVFETGQGHIGPYRFSTRVFQGLIQYVWQGGYPGWKEEVRPPYVLEMKETLQKSPAPFFKGVFSS